MPRDVATEHAELLTLINALRTKQGRPTLSINQALNTAAQAHASWLAQRGGDAQHEGKDGSMPPQRARDAGYPKDNLVTENAMLGGENAQRAYEGWLGSPGHKANLLFFAATESGLGIATAASGAVYWVHKLGGSLRNARYGEKEEGLFNYYNAWRSYYATGNKQQPGLATTLERNAELDAVAAEMATTHLQTIADNVPDQIDLAQNLTAPLQARLPKATANFTISGGTVSMGPESDTITQINVDRNAYAVAGTHIGVAYRVVTTKGFSDSYGVIVIGKKK
jgi:uncharacterized protein YkwD